MIATLSAVPASEIRNRQAGDWTYNADGSITALSANLGNPDYEFLVALHELVEAYLCRKRGITDEQVSAFDELFETERELGLHSQTDENGDDPRAPYVLEHRTASIVEMIVADALGVDWNAYSEAINAL